MKCFFIRLEDPVVLTGDNMNPLTGAVTDLFCFKQTKTHIVLLRRNKNRNRFINVFLQIF